MNVADTATAFNARARERSTNANEPSVQACIAEKAATTQEPAAPIQDRTKSESVTIVNICISNSAASHVLLLLQVFFAGDVAFRVALFKDRGRI